MRHFEGKTCMMAEVTQHNGIDPSTHGQQQTICRGKEPFFQNMRYEPFKKHELFFIQLEIARKLVFLMKILLVCNALIVA